MLAVIIIVMAYLIGAIPFALIVCAIFGVGDIRKQGSGNIGATNAWRVAGFKVAVWVFIGDIGKGVVAVLLARYVTSTYDTGPLSPDLFIVACALAAIVGHVFPVYLRFKGGKGVNTSLGAVVTMLPVEALISFGVFLAVVLVFRYISLGSIVGAVAFLASVVIEKFAMDVQMSSVYVYMAAVLAALIIVAHRQNISRLLAGTENRFSFSSKKSGERSDG
ncbi:MAG: glycerol-3-phosphate 1-O-acyltransferase PlsY [Candidatus Zixiibacteriota bacterium]